MKIFINDIYASNKQSVKYDYEIDIDNCNIDSRDVVFNEKPKLSCTITRNNDDTLYADINIHLDTTLNCVRCLDEMKAVEDINFSGILSKEDMDVDYDLILYDEDNYLDLDKIFYDGVFELLQDYMFCKDDCKGLCQICGVNLNKQSCNCEQEHPNIDPRLAELKNFFK